MGLGGDFRDPEVKMAAMLAKDLGVNVDAKALRLFVIARWKRLSALAHDIHNAEVGPVKKEPADD